MTQPPRPPDDNQPYEYGQRPSQQASQHNDWISSSSQSAGRPEDTQQLPPHGQGSAGQPYAGAYSQPSGGNPYNPYTRPSAGAPYQQSHPYDPNQPPAGPPGGGAFGSWQPQPAQPKKRFNDANPLKAAFDFSFNSYATPGLVKIIYILAAIVAALWWIGGGLAALITGIAARSFGGGSGTVALGVLGCCWAGFPRCSGCSSCGSSWRHRWPWSGWPTMLGISAPRSRTTDAILTQYSRAVAGSLRMPATSARNREPCSPSTIR